MAEAVVDRLEVVEVDEEDGAEVAGPAAAVEGVLDPVAEQAAVGEAGERIVERLVAELLLAALELADLLLERAG